MNMVTFNICCAFLLFALVLQFFSPFPSVNIVHVLKSSSCSGFSSSLDNLQTERWSMERKKKTANEKGAKNLLTQPKHLIITFFSSLPRKSTALRHQRGDGGPSGEALDREQVQVRTVRKAFSEPEQRMEAHQGSFWGKAFCVVSRNIFSCCVIGHENVGERERIFPIKLKLKSSTDAH